MEQVERRYQMRLVSRHTGDDNAMVGLEVELCRDGEDWLPSVLGDERSAFLCFLHTAFTCQLAYLRMNTVERGLSLESVRGTCEVDTVDFVLRRFVVTFAMELRSGQPNDDDLAYLRERCLACPVSRNLEQIAEKDTRVTVEG